jgi:uncharacterized protein (TIGR03118 family)
MLKIHSFPRLGTCVCILAIAVTPAWLHADSYTQTNLVSDISGLAANTDPNLKNPWGVSFTPTSPFWSSDQVTGVATLYNAAGVPNTLVVTIPGSSTPPSGPTGQVFNADTDTSAFLVGTTKATFIFDTLNGTIAGWNGGATATTKYTGPAGTVYTGLAQGTTGGATYLYAANSNPTTGNIQVFDSTWTNVTTTTFAGKFIDPNPVSGFAPFNVQNINGNLYVTYAEINPKGGPLPGGYVDEFDTNGNFIKRIATDGPLEAPWGITLAPSGFGSYSNDLLIGNFGNGEILVYDPTTDTYIGTLDDNGLPIVNDFLWALETRIPGGTFNPNAVYFTAGINDQQDGLFGEITLTPEPSTFIGTATGLIGLAIAGFRRRFSRN